MTNKIIQKDIIFDMSFTFSIFGMKQGIRLLEKKYNAKNITKKWSIKKPFYVTIIARVNITHDVDVDKMRKKQHELMIKGGTV